MADENRGTTLYARKMSVAKAPPLHNLFRGHSKSFQPGIG